MQYIEFMINELEKTKIAYQKEQEKKNSNQENLAMIEGNMIGLIRSLYIYCDVAHKPYRTFQKRIQPYLNILNI